MDKKTFLISREFVGGKPQRIVSESSVVCFSDKVWDPKCEYLDEGIGSMFQ